MRWEYAKGDSDTVGYGRIWLEYSKERKDARIYSGNGIRVLYEYGRSTVGVL